MAYRRVILDSANNERDEIIKYLVSVSGKVAASDFLSALDREVAFVSELLTIRAVSRMPELAEKGYRTAFFGSCVMLYFFKDVTVFVAHTFHQRQNYAHLV